jgi:ketosteroid isomerase-like protein
MSKYRVALVLSVTACVLFAVAAVPSGELPQSQSAKDEQTVWNLDHAYWRYVQDNDLTGYLTLWQKDFLGWPGPYAAPSRKDHITDWIISGTSKGLAFKTVEFKPAGIQITGNVAATCYWITFKWVDKDGKGPAQTSRITHVWLKNGKDWQIISGMSMPEPATPQN